MKKYGLGTKVPSSMGLQKTTCRANSRTYIVYAERVPAISIDSIRPNVITITPR